MLESLGKETIQFDFLTLNILRTRQWAIEELMDWLLGGHIHFIICHMHQGVENSDWCVVDLYTELNQRLQTHEGFPKGVQLSCPIFTQDKQKYLELFPDVTLPSYFVPIPKTTNDAVTCATMAR